MLKTMAGFEHKIGDRSYYFYCENTAPTGDVKEALSQFMTQVTNIENSVRLQQEQAAADAAKADEIPPVNEPCEE